MKLITLIITIAIIASTQLVPIAFADRSVAATPTPQPVPPGREMKKK